MKKLLYISRTYGYVSDVVLYTKHDIEVSPCLVAVLYKAFSSFRFTLSHGYFSVM